MHNDTTDSRGPVPSMAFESQETRSIRSDENENDDDNDNHAMNRISERIEGENQMTATRNGTCREEK